MNFISVYKSSLLPISLHCYALLFLASSKFSRHQSELRFDSVTSIRLHIDLRRMKAERSQKRSADEICQMIIYRKSLTEIGFGQKRRYMNSFKSDSKRNDSEIYEGFIMSAQINMREYKV